MDKDTILYSVPVGERRKGESHVYRHPKYADKLRPIPEGYSSLADIWDSSLKKFGQKELI